MISLASGISEMPKTHGDISKSYNLYEILQVLLISFAIRKLFLGF